nr:immunoglobulin light chain junction region [Macaca mulatta]
CQQYNSNPLTL